MQNGWIRLHRQLRDSQFYTNSKAIHCWIECLLRANHQTQNYFLGRKNITLKPGEFIAGRDEFGKKIGISGSTAWFWLLQFEVDRMLDIKKTTKGSLFTIINWEKYQPLDSKVDNKKTTDEQQKNTDKNDKNEKNKIAGKPAEQNFNSLEYNKNINELMGLFIENLNPALKWENKTERNACEELIKNKNIGFEKIKIAINVIIKNKADQYLPTITKPTELVRKYGALQKFGYSLINK